MSTTANNETLERIKNEVCLEITGCPACDLIPMVWNPKLIDAIAKRYAFIVAEASLKEAAENATSHTGWKHMVDKSSITNEKNIKLI